MLSKRISESKRRIRSEWSKKWLLERNNRSACNCILEELRLDDQENYRRILRVNTHTFEVNYVTFYYPFIYFLFTFYYPFIYFLFTFYLLFIYFLFTF